MHKAGFKNAVATLGTAVTPEHARLIKKYTSNQEIKDIVISNNVAGIIFRNKVEFLSL